MILDSMNAPVPKNGILLFDGSSLDGWTSKDGSPAKWTVADGTVQVVTGTGDICTTELFTDHYLHIEFQLADMPDATGQGKSNSGVYLQGRYEIQVLDSAGWDVPGLGDCGGVYDQYAPLTNACKPALTWQTFDVIFRAPRCEGKVVKEKARLTAFQNGIVIHNNVELPGVTGGPTDTDVQLPGHLRLQDHGHPVDYRNIWAVRLPREGACEYPPRMRE